MYPVRPVGSLAAGLLSDLSHYAYDINRGNLFLRIKNFVVTSVVVEKIPENSAPNTTPVLFSKEQHLTSQVYNYKATVFPRLKANQLRPSDEFKGPKDATDSERNFTLLYRLLIFTRFAWLTIFNNKQTKRNTNYAYEANYSPSSQKIESNAQ